MDISLREWLIIGGVLIVILILVDGWRRVSNNRSRLRLEIDRTLSELDEPDPHNPELPNGGARKRHGEEQASALRVEPGFADDRLGGIEAEPAMAEMDPLFDDIPPAPRRTPQPATAHTSAVEAGEDAAGDDTARDEPHPRAGRNKAEATPGVHLPSDPVSPELKNLDLERPIPVLLDEVDADEHPELPDDTLAAYRESLGDAEQKAAEPPLEATIEAATEAAAEATAAMEDKPAVAKVELAKAVTPSASPSPKAAVEYPDDRSLTGTQPTRATGADTQATESWNESAESGGSGSHIDPQMDTPIDTSIDTSIDTGAEHQPPFQSEPVTAAEPAPKAANRGLKSMPDPEHVLIITVVGRNGQHLPGPALDRIVQACGMEWGDMAIYHRPEDSRPDAPIQFSMANAVAPGTFDPEHLDALETPAVTFFMSMNEPGDAMTAYECMLATAETLAKHLDGDLLDEDRSVMRPQTKEHYRERIRDFEMQRRQRRAN